MPMRIDQTGLSVGVPGFARPDLLSNGATVTLTDTTAGGTSIFEILYRPPADTDSVSSLTPQLGNDHVWTFHATVGVEGPWRIRLRHILPNGSLIEEIRILGFSASGTGDIPPAPNERASEDASDLNKTDSDIIFKSERNWSTTDYPSGNPYGWSNSITTSGGGAVNSVFGRSGTVVAVTGDYTATKITNDSSVSGASVKDALNTLLSASVISVFGRTGAVVAVAGDYSASKVTNDSSVSGATVKDALNALLSTTSLQSAYNAGATIALSSTDIVISKSAVELLHLGSAATVKAADKSTTGSTGDAVQILGSKGGAAAPAGTPGDGGTVTIVAGTVGSETAAPGGSVGSTSTAHVVIQGGAAGNVSGIKAGSVFLHGGQIGTGISGGTNVPGDVKIGTDANKTHTVRSGQSGGTPWEHQGPLWTPMVTLVDGATITVSADKSCTHKVVIGGARTLDFSFPASFSNSIVSPTGITGSLVVQQDATGGRTLAFASKIKTSGDVSLNSAANALTVFLWVIESPTIVHLRKVEATTGTGDFVGPGSSVSGNIVSFSGTTGKLGQDSGVAAASVVVGPASVVTARIATFNGTTGKLIQDSGTLVTDLVPTTRTITAGTGLSGGGDLSANRTLTVTSAPAITSATTTINTSSATAPTAGQVLQATSGTAAQWVTLTTGPASQIATSGTPVTISSTAPSAGQILTATSATAAQWSAPAAVPISTGVSGLGTGVATFLATPSSANLAAALTDETGSGALVFATSPTLVTPALGTPSSGVLSSCTGRVNASQTADQIATSGTAVAISSTAPSSGQVLQASSATAASWQTLTAGPASQIATSGTPVSISSTAPSAGQILTATSATAAQWSAPAAVPISTGVSGLGTGVATFLGTPSSANLAAAITDETGSGALVFATSPTLVTPALGTPSSGVLSSCTGRVNANQTADQIATSGTAVTIGSTAPTTGQVLTATSATAASWQTPSGGGVVTPTNFTWSSNAASINVAAGGVFVSTNTMGGNSTLTLTSGVDGSTGRIYVKQDATGSRTLTFSISGRTIIRDANSTDDNPESSANSLTAYDYEYITVVSTAYVRITKVFM